LRDLQAEQTAEEIHVLEHRECGVEIATQSLRQERDARVEVASVAPVAHVGAQYRQLPTLQRASAGDQGQQARLADAIGSDEPDDAAGRKIKLRDVERREVLVPQRDV